MEHSDLAPQPPPKASDERPIYLEVIDDVRAKAEGGLAKYGTYLQSDNGRDHLTDAYQEAIDLTKYLKAAIKERERLVARIAFLEAMVEGWKEKAKANLRLSGKMMTRIAELTAQVADLQAKLSLAVEALGRIKGSDPEPPDADGLIEDATCVFCSANSVDGCDEDCPREIARDTLTALAPTVAAHETRLKDLESQNILDTLCENLEHFRESWNSITGMDDGTRRWLIAALERTSARLKRQGAAEALLEAIGHATTFYGGKGAEYVSVDTIRALAAELEAPDA